ncbi:MAG: N-acetylmuramoyl-L-alanine amidase [Pseudomonadota bacterium]
MVVIHYTAMQTAEAACQTLCNPKTEVSAHYLIARDGQVMSLVAEDQRAWHAGAGGWGKLTDVNSYSIGIELDNNGLSPFSAPLMDALVVLLEGIIGRWAIRPERVIGHSDMAPGRKIDPGPRFDWQRLACEGQSIWPNKQDKEPISAEDFRRHALLFGYPDVSDALLLDTVRRRFRPWAQGPLDALDMGLIADLASRFPVDARVSNA